MALRLLKENGETEKIPDPRPDLVDYFRKKYEAITGKPEPIKFGGCMVMMYRRFVIPDEASREIYIEYPELPEWQKEVDGFFKDEFAKKVKYHFSYLCKQYGRFAPIEKREPTDPMLKYVCECDHEVRMKKSEWARYANKQGTCSICKKKFSVNDVLNQLPEIGDVISQLS